MPADQIFVLVLVIGIMLGLTWLSWDTRRRAKLDELRQAEAVAAAPQSPAEDMKERTRTERQRKRQAR